MKAPGTFEIRDKDLAGRIARLHTPHGVLETPALLPVIDILRQEVPIEEIRRLGFNAVITNAYLLWKRMRSKALEEGVHRILGFDGIVMTDSGAYQILEYGDVDISPKEVVEFEKRIGSDIAVILDIPTGNARDRAQAEYSVEETLRRAREARSLIDPENRVWVLPVQGGPFRDLVERSASEAARLDGYKLYALGSPTVLLERYEYTSLIEMIHAARSRLPLTRPLHLFGAGHPMIIPFAVALGVDMFDSASYILYARTGRYMTRSRTYRLEELDYFPCSCPVCTRHSPEELREMPAPQRTRLLALHNLYVLREAINEAKTAIREGRLWELLEERSTAHPSLASAFRLFRRYAEKLATLTPHPKPRGVHGVFLVGEMSLYNPHVIEHRRRLMHNYEPPRRDAVVLVPVDPRSKPFTSSRCYREAKKRRPEAHIVGYTPYMGVIPEELAETYPLSQYEMIEDPPRPVIEEAASFIARYVEEKGYSTAEVLLDERLPWSMEIAGILAEKLGERLTGRNRC